LKGENPGITEKIFSFKLLTDSPLPGAIRLESNPSEIGAVEVMDTIVERSIDVPVKGMEGGKQDNSLQAEKACMSIWDGASVKRATRGIAHRAREMAVRLGGHNILFSEIDSIADQSISNRSTLTANSLLNSKDALHAAASQAQTQAL